MLTSPTEPSASAFAQVRAWLRVAPWSALAELACRGGYLARGFIYLSIGTIAVAAALDLAPKAEGSRGVLEAWADWPFGVVLLWLAGLGLYAFAGWRLLQSAFDADRQGASLRAIGSRLGQAVSGVVYGALGASVFGLIDTLEDLTEADDEAETRRTVAAVLDLPGGELLVAGAGLFILGAGIGNIVQVFGRDFCKPLACDEGVRRWAPWIGRAGYLGRGIAFLPVGALMLTAGLKTRSQDATGIGGALQMMEGQPYGDALMTTVALGLIAFGAFAFIEARYRRIAVDQALGG
ncbi:DUF1206 domain-containing protein [Phenylobacterium sp.]|uniref:DUF1206 domain-containing protein n=1 Tax=Phenylobacterium sp. TaxID=1871053 RepID=UPI0030F46587